MAASNPTGQRNLVTFRLDRQTCALPIEPIVQIIEMVSITPIPQASKALEGVINVRGVSVPVINLRRYLGLPEAALQLHTPIILTRVGETVVGLIVDEVLDLLTLPVDQIVHLADMMPGGLGEVPIWQGLVHTPGGIVLLLDLDHLFSAPPDVGLTQAVETLSKAMVPALSTEEEAPREPHPPEEVKA